jgi:putative copper export protein
VALVVVAGVYLAVIRLPQISDLWETGYGQTLVVKVAIVCAALALGAFHQMIVKPRIERHAEPRGVGVSLMAEGTIAVAVLLVAAMLVNGAPPVVESSSGAVPAAFGR